MTFFLVSVDGEGDKCKEEVKIVDGVILAELNYLVIDQEIAKRVGKNSRKAVLDQYSWNVEALKLILFYAAPLREK
jgi:hypothetical protein